MVSLSKQPPPAEVGPAWDVARLFPNQGQWGEGDYLILNRQGNRLIELSDGHVEVLEMPTRSHQRIVLHLRDALRAFCEVKGLGETLVAPYPLRLRPEKFREPDVLFVLAKNAGRFGEDYAEWADLVVEVVSENRIRDFQTKRRDYAEAGIPEYWIVDPEERRVTVLRLEGTAYTVHGEWGMDETATSVLLPGFCVSVSDVFGAATGRDKGGLG